MTNLKSQISNLKFLSTVYILLIILFFFYSFTQVDLSLTLSQASVYQSIQKVLQYIGYFDRPLSTGLFVGITAISFVLYIFLLSLSYKGKVISSSFWKLFIPVVVILMFSYNAFSYDLFNYIFDAKIVTHYGQNPYEHKALDYAAVGEPMLSFMQWTHRVYPYGPVWLGLTVPVSYIGFNYFLPTFFLFKILIVGSFILSVLAISKITKIVNPKYQVFSMVFFGLNPFILMESVVSAHNDIVMMMFVLWSFYFLIKDRFVFSFILLLFSIGIKFATGVLVPVYILYFFLKKTQKKINWNLLFLCAVIFMSLGVVIATFRTNFQPWYLLYILPFLALLSYKYYAFIPAIILSIGGAFYYVPYLFNGNWNQPIPSQLLNYEMGVLITGFVITGGYFLFNQKYKKAGGVIQ